MFVPLCVFLGSLSYALCVNFVPSYKVPIDAIMNADYGSHGQSPAAGENSASQSSGIAEKHEVVVEETV